MKEIYGIGHSNTPIATLIDRLLLHRIDIVVDVRSFARSRWPQFNGRALASALADHGIRYEHRPRLGGKNIAPADELRNELMTVLERAGRLCLLCSEGDYRKCHRHHVLARIIEELGGRMVEILKDGRLESPTGSVTEDRFK